MQGLKYKSLPVCNIKLPCLHYDENMLEAPLMIWIGDHLLKLVIYFLHTVHTLAQQDRLTECKLSFLEG